VLVKDMSVVKEIIVNLIDVELVDVNLLDKILNMIMPKLNTPDWRNFYQLSVLYWLQVWLSSLSFSLSTYLFSSIFM
jgi:hypothetical protein